jgi:hypothetical protein
MYLPEIFFSLAMFLHGSHVNIVTLVATLCLSCYRMDFLMLRRHNDAGTINKHILMSGFMRAKNRIETNVSKKENECPVTLQIPLYQSSIKSSVQLSRTILTIRFSISFWKQKHR